MYKISVNKNHCNNQQIKDYFVDLHQTRTEDSWETEMIKNIVIDGVSNYKTYSETKKTYIENLNWYIQYSDIGCAHCENYFLIEKNE